VIRYAARAVPWPLVLTTCAVVAALMALVAAWPEVVWPLQGAAVGLLAGAAAWSMDETAAAVVDTLPRPLWWRTAARTAAVVPLALVWSGCVLIAGDRLPPHSDLFLLQGFAAVIVAVAFVTWRRAHGEAAPGDRVAPAAIAAAVALALIRPFPDRVPLFPVWAYEEWGLSLAIWSALAAASAVLLAISLRPARRSG
jgi:hypothetical protein